MMPPIINTTQFHPENFSLFLKSGIKRSFISIATLLTDNSIKTLIKVINQYGSGAPVTQLIRH